MTVSREASQCDTQEEVFFFCRHLTAMDKGKLYQKKRLLIPSWVSDLIMDNELDELESNCKRGRWL
jgi:hypothetical protein